MCKKIKIADGLEMTPGKIESKRVVITKTMAEQILKRYQDYIDSLPETERKKKNRRISPKVIDKYSKDMINNNFNGMMNDDICFDENGILINGHHRIHSIIVTGLDFECFVKFNVKPNPSMDKGRRRNDVDNLIMFSDVPDDIINNDTNGLVTFLLSYLGFSSNYTLEDKENFYKEYEDDFRTMLNQFNFPHVKLYSVVEIYTAFFIAYLNGISLTELQGFYDTLRSNMTSGHICDNVVFKLRNWMDNNISGSSSVKKERYIRCLYAIQAYHENKVKANPRSNRLSMQPVYHITYNGVTF